MPNGASRELVAPNKLLYAKNTDLVLNGAKIVEHWDIVGDTYVDVTADMITTAPDMTTTGEKTVTGTYNGYNFSFTINVVEDALQTITINQMPTKTTYTHRQGVTDIDVTGGKIDLNYASGQVITIDMSSAMLPATESADWKIGTVNYVCLYEGVEFILPVTFENKALTITQFLSADTAAGTYDLTGIVVGPVNTAFRAELLLKEKDSMTFFSVGEVGIIGDYNSITLDTTVINAGDEIILQATKSLSTATSGGRLGRTEASAGKLANFKANLIVVSTGNALNYDLSVATTVTNQEQLSAFMSSTDRFWKIIKVTSDIKAVKGSSGWKFTYGESVDANSYAVGTAGVWMSNVNFAWYAKPITDYFTAAAKNNDFANPSTTIYDMYLMCVGGNSSLHSLTPLAENWIVSK